MKKIILILVLLVLFGCDSSLSKESTITIYFGCDETIYEENMVYDKTILNHINNVLEEISSHTMTSGKRKDNLKYLKINYDNKSYFLTESGEIYQGDNYFALDRGEVYKDLVYKLHVEKYSIENYYIHLEDDKYIEYLRYCFNETNDVKDVVTDFLSPKGQPIDMEEREVNTVIDSKRLNIKSKEYNVIKERKAARIFKQKDIESLINEKLYVKYESEGSILFLKKISMKNSIHIL